jgi:hypothetical protein
MKHSTILVILVLMGMVIISACGNIPTVQPTLIPTATAYPTYTPLPTYTLFPTYTNTPSPTSTSLINYRTPTPQPNSNSTDSGCIPITDMDYSNNSKVAIQLQAYVNKLPGVRAVSFTIPERLYSNTISVIIFVSFINDEDGKVYSHRYIVYMKELGWQNGVFSIDGQCWIDPPHQ